MFSFPLGVGPAIAVIDDALPKALCYEIIGYIEGHPHLLSQGKTLGGVDPEIKRTNDTWISPNNEFASAEELQTLSRLNNEIFIHFSPVLTAYCSYYKYMDNWTSRYDTGYQFQKYEKGVGKYVSHIDGSAFDPYPHNLRVVAAVMYLNTVDEGGETYFDNFDYAVKPEVGRILLFPTNYNYEHGGLVPISGDKYIISTFAYSPRD